jgi:hypothetical protein
MTSDRWATIRVAVRRDVTSDSRIADSETVGVIS